jgi:hypothetical protein
LNSTVDQNDHPYILGVAEDGREKGPLADVLQDAEANGENGTLIDMHEKQWYKSVDLCTFDQGDSEICFYSINLIYSTFLALHSDSCPEKDRSPGT